MLALSCGPAVVTWDCGSGPSHGRIDPYSDEGSAGCRIFHPHGRNSNVASLTWNHNEQVLATCSSSSDDDEPNVALVHAETGTNLETLSSFFPSGSSGGSKSRNGSHRGNTVPPASAAAAAAATGVGFGGKSRYLVVSDASGCASVWDLKKTARVRTFRIPRPASSGGAFSGAVCTAARIDPTDTFVAAASGWDTDGALRLYRLREGKLAATLRDVRPGLDESTGEWDGHGGISALEFSDLDKSVVSVGTRDGSVLLWDVQAATKVGRTDGGSRTSPSESKAAVPPTMRMAQRHGGEVTGIAFSPINTVLLASSSADGTVAFHDTKMCRTIQSFRPPINENVVSNGSSAVMSVSFASDGVTCAAGTADGRALIYDLRNIRAGPLSTLEFVPKGSDEASLPVPPVLNLRFTSLGAVSSHVISAPVTTERNEEAPIMTAASIDPPKFEQPVKVDEAAADKATTEPTSSSRKPRHVNEEEKKSSTGDTSVTKFSADSVVEQGNDVGAMAEKSLESLLSKLSASSTNNVPSVRAIAADDDVVARVSDGPDLTVNKLVLRRMIQDEIDDLREEMASSISNVHVDMLRQFQRQSSEMQAMFQRQAQSIEELMEQNRLLREENERLKLPVYGEY
mmetsp:Transcript_17753/g.41910  ORF Transcript_17753/g.41910 Transcript_17753/m.41910 type:complete len:627 (-) Transcript_17753:79-1959(-)